MFVVSILFTCRIAPLYGMLKAECLGLSWGGACELIYIDTS